MHPARSLILFTSLSGLGFGLLVFLGLGLPSVTGWPAFIHFGLAYGLAVGGLMSSTFHLGHPERALKAFTQWRSSWLSREAWLAVAALVVMGLHAASSVFLAKPLPVIGAIGAALALATVGATSMIYGQLKTVPRWHDWSTPLVFIALSLTGGALLSGQTRVAFVVITVAAAVQIWAWISGDQRLAASGTDIGTATGLGDRGAVRAFEPPHTGGNYLTSEMIFVVARKHAIKLRLIASVLAFLLPFGVLMLGGHPIVLVFAAFSHVSGLLILRWLFFAEAEHVVGIYYGKR